MSSDFFIPQAPLSWRMKASVFLFLALLASAAYAPFQGLPLMSDDYLQIDMSREYGPASGWPRVAVDPLYRSRATSHVLTVWTERLFGLTPAAFHLSSLAVHIVNVWLVFLLGWWRVIGWRVAAFSAAFFAIQIAPQEAVVWYAAVHELLHLLFALLTIHCWLRWLHSKRERYYAASLALLLLALLSKESAVAIAPLLGVLGLVDGAGWRRIAIRVLPHALMTLAYMLLIFAAAPAHGHFHDAGTFSFSAPFWRTWLISQGRLFWIWGLAALIALAIWRPAGQARLLFLAGSWAGLALLPYCFLTYMPFVPSRHTYFASAGEALIVGAAFSHFASLYRRKGWAVAALALLIIGHQWVYLWVWKLPHYRQRAADTEDLIRFAEHVPGPIYIHCFPVGIQAAEMALKLRLGKPMVYIGSVPDLSQYRGRNDVYCLNPREHLKD